MPNPIANLFAQRSQNTVPSNFIEFANMYKNQSPKQIVQNLLDSGRMTQDQFNQFSQIADMLTKKKN